MSIDPVQTFSKGAHISCAMTAHILEPSEDSRFEVVDREGEHKDRMGAWEVDVEIDINGCCVVVAFLEEKADGACLGVREEPV